MSGTCDVVIPVHNQFHWVSLCIDELLSTTPAESLGQVFLVDDNSAADTTAGLARLSKGHPSIHVLSNNGGRGFAAAANTGLAASTAAYVLILNTDCLLTPNAIPKLIAHCERDRQIGLISPLSNNSAPLTVPMLPGFSYRGMNSLLEERFSGEWAEACTIVGNALLITRDCLEKTGALDTSYGLGYGEETDYQFRAMANGFKAAAALDTYVYHKGAESFGQDLKTMARAQSKGRKLFFERWNTVFAGYSKRVPPGRAAESVIEALSGVEARGATAMIVLPSLNQAIGGCHVVVDICNSAARLGQPVQLAVLRDKSRTAWYDALFFEPIYYASEVEFAADRHFSPRLIVATSWDTVFPVKLRAGATGVWWHYFVQGYEFYFEEGRIYGAVEETFRGATHVFTTSKWLKNKVAAHFSGPVEVLPAGFDETLFYPDPAPDGGLPTVTLALRGSIDKGQPFLMDLLHRMAVLQERIRLILMVAGDPMLPDAWMDRCEIYRMPLRKPELAAILRRTAVFIDGSLHEGFGLLPLEALACGGAVITSQSGGVSDFVQDGKNGFLVCAGTDPESYLERLQMLLNDPSLLASLRGYAAGSVLGFRSECVMRRHCEYLRKAATEERPRKHIVSSSLGAMFSMRFAGVRSAFDNQQAFAPYNGDPLADRLSALERNVDSILASRIWRTLCTGGGVLLRAGGVMRGLLHPFRRGGRPGRKG